MSYAKGCGLERLARCHECTARQPVASGNNERARTNPVVLTAKTNVDAAHVTCIGSSRFVRTENGRMQTTTGCEELRLGVKRELRNCCEDRALGNASCQRAALRPAYARRSDRGRARRPEVIRRVFGRERIGLMYDGLQRPVNPRSSSTACEYGVCARRRKRCVALAPGTLRGR